MRDADAVATRIELARDVVYDEAGEIIDMDEIDAALAEHGVSVTEGIDGNPVYDNVPEGLSLSACYLAVELQKDPSEFIGFEGSEVDP